jgi:hypothetical protein
MADTSLKTFSGPHSQNPFLTGFRVQQRSRRKTLATEDRQGIINLDTGEVTAAAEMVKIVPRDSEKFLKIFSEHLPLFFGLSGPAMKVLASIWIEVARFPSHDSVMMTERIAEQHAKNSGHELSRTTYYRGRRELIEKGIVAASSESSMLWINPAFFFNGNRLPLIPSHKENTSRPGADDYAWALSPEPEQLVDPGHIFDVEGAQ